MPGRMIKKWRLPFSRVQAACVAGGVILYAVLELASGPGDRRTAEGAGFKRAGPGQGTTTYELQVTGLDRDDENRRIPVRIPVRERQYTAEEARALFEELQPELKEQMLGQNESLEEVRHDLNLKSSLEDYGFTVVWESDAPELIDSFGTVHNEDVSENGESVWLSARVTDRIRERRYEFKVTVYPPSLLPEEQLAASFEKWADRLDLKQQTRDSLLLPRIYNGQSLDYSLPKEDSYRVFPVLGVLSAALIHMKRGIDKQKQARRRERQLLYDYSEVVSKLVVYIGAGLTVRGAWERIAAGYEDAVKRGKRNPRPVYEEMVRTAAQLGSGQAEGKAYSEFGRRCGLQSYLKLSALLEQGQKNGSRQLRPSLELEMVSAFEQRKNLAKKLGEEAGTRLLFPLFLMLGVVMIMIVVPAFLSFY
ncbi:immunoglobulin-like domain-containing protein [Lachnospiraceae bacterium 54-53]